MGILNKTDFKEIDLAKQTINYKKMEKLTLQDCFKYPNARIERITEKSVGDVFYDNVFELIYRQGDFDSRTNTNTLKGIFEDYTLCEYQLILRPIESLTDEEKKIYDKLDKKIYKKDIIDYCRSINIDIDDLQEKGVAVYE